jgi:hypothetical protein
MHRRETQQGNRRFTPGGAASAPWSPSSLSGLLQELDADSSNIVFNGPDVASWIDSNLLFDATQASPVNQPVFEALGWGTYSSIATDGVAEFLACDALGLELAGDDTPYTVTVCAQMLVSTGALEAIWCAGATSNNFALIRLSDGAVNFDAFTRDDANSGSRNIATSPIDTGRHQHTLRFDGTTLAYYIDGVSVGTSATAQGVCSLDRVTIGGMRRMAGLETPGSVRIPGITVYDRALNVVTELPLLWQYNRDHFGNLP